MGSRAFLWVPGLVASALIVGACAGQDGREMVANGIGRTPEPSEVSTSLPSASLPEGKVPEGGDSDVDQGAVTESVGEPGSVYFDSFSGTVGGNGSYELSHPQLSGLAIDHPVNVLLRLPTEKIREEFVADLVELSMEEGGSVDGDVLRGAGSVYLLDDRLVSVVYDLRIDWEGAADVDERVASVLLDLRSGAQLGLGDLFVPESPWMETIGFFVRQDLEGRLGAGVLWPDGRGLELEESNYSVFALTAEELVVRFPMHQVAPGAAGVPVATVPWASLVGLLDPAGPAGHLTG